MSGYGVQEILQLQYVRQHLMAYEAHVKSHVKNERRASIFRTLLPYVAMPAGQVLAHAAARLKLKISAGAIHHTLILCVIRQSSSINSRLHG